MAKAKAPLEIRKAKEELEQEITNILYDVITMWHMGNPDWTVTDVDLAIIDISTMNEHLSIPATAVVEITKKDLTMKISKHGTVKEMK